MMRMIKNRIILLLCSVVVATGVILINMSCTNSPSGALEYNTMSYYINGKFHDSIPDSIVRKEYGIVIQEQNGFEHSYRVFEELRHLEREIQYCTVHKNWEIITGYYQAEKAKIEYMVKNYKRGWK